MRVIDLFSGLGGFSRAFLDRGHDVERIDKDPRFLIVPNTVQRDVLDLTADDLRGADIVLASPPCTCFSFAAQAKYWPHLGERHPAVDESLRLIRHTLSIMREADTRYWVLENPFNRLREFIGAPAAKTAWCAWGTVYKKPTYLWGKLPPVDWKIPHKWDGDSRGGAGNGAIGSPYPSDPALIALIPYEFSLALCLAAEGNSAQETLLVYGRDSQ